MLVFLSDLFTVAQWLNHVVCAQSWVVQTCETSRPPRQGSPAAADDDDVRNIRQNSFLDVQGESLASNDV